MIKKLAKFCFIAAVAVVLLAAGALFTLYKLYPPARLKLMAQQYVSTHWQREVTFDKLSFTWIGFKFTNVALSENTTFANGTFAKAKKLTAHVAVKPLLQKRIEITTIEADGLEVNLVQKKDGKYNFDTLLPDGTDEVAQPQATPTSGQEQAPLVVTAQRITLKSCNLIYRDENTGLHMAANDLNIVINQFDLAKPFESTLSFTSNISVLGQPRVTVPVEITLQTFLANLDLPQAYAHITQASARYNAVQVGWKGEINNFENPSLNLSGTITGLSSQQLKALAPDLPAFNLPPLQLSVHAQADLDKNSAQISQAKLAVQNSSLSAHGTVDWGKVTPTWSFTGSLKAILEELVEMTESWDDFRPAGTILSNLTVSSRPSGTDTHGTVTLQDVSLWYDPFTITHGNGTITLASLDKISSPKLTGKLNGEPFTGAFSYESTPQVTDWTVNLNLDKLVLKSWPDSDDAQSSAEGSNTSANNASAQNDATPSRTNLQADIQIGAVDIPYVQSEGFSAQARLRDMTDSLAGTNGTVSFELQPGKITNLDTFINQSKVAKILLLPVSVVRKTSGMLGLKLFAEKDETTGTSIAFTKGEGSYTFTNGVMNLDKTALTSSVTDLSAKGTVDFNTEELNMKATATLLTQAAPVAFKITGTLSNPKGKLDVVNTVTSVVGGLLNGTALKSATNGATSATTTAGKLTVNTVKGTVDTATSVIKGIGGLFKKKDPSAEEEPTSFSGAQEPTSSSEEPASAGEEPAPTAQSASAEEQAPQEPQEQQDPAEEQVAQTTDEDPISTSD